MSDRNETALRPAFDYWLFAFGAICLMILGACGSSNVIQDEFNQQQYTLVVPEWGVSADRQAETMAEAVMARRGYTSYQLVDRRAALSKTEYVVLFSGKRSLSEKRSRQRPSLILTEAKRRELGSIAIRAGDSLPVIEAVEPKSDVTGKTLQGAALGFGLAALLVSVALLVAPATAPAGLAGLAYLAPILGASTATLIGGPIVGGSIGAMTASSEESVQADHVSIKKALEQLKMSASIRDEIAAMVRTEPQYRLAGDGKGTLHAAPADTVVQVDVEKIRFSPPSYQMKALGIRRKSAGFSGVPEYWPFAIGLSVTVRLIRVSDSVNLYNQAFEYRGSGRPFNEWASDKAALFREELQYAYRAIARKVTESLFLVYPVPGPDILYPGPSISELWETHPTFQWQRFSKIPDTQSGEPISSLEPVEYDLELDKGHRFSAYNSQAEYDRDLRRVVSHREPVYRRSGLTGTEHTMVQELGCGDYSLAVRARFRINGRRRLSRFKTQPFTVPCE